MDSKVINLEDYRNSKKGKKKQGGSSKRSKSVPVIAIDELREKIIAEERRKVKRTMLTEFIGASVVLPGSGLVKVTLNDISLEGLSFDIAKKFGSFSKSEEVALRLYLNHTTYFPMTLKVTNMRYIAEIGYYRHGAKFLKSSQNQEALGHFIKFIETVNTSLKADHGDILLSK